VETKARKFRYFGNGEGKGVKFAGKAAFGWFANYISIIKTS
jgi:hypothetical protein